MIENQQENFDTDDFQIIVDSKAFQEEIVPESEYDIINKRSKKKNGINMAQNNIVKQLYKNGNKDKESKRAKGVKNSQLVEMFKNA